MPAPGAPGAPATWTSSAKDFVTTALGPSRLWATVGQGVVSEVYWPSTGEPQLRDLGFIVAGPNGWTEVRRAGRYEVGAADQGVPLPVVRHHGDGFDLELEIVPDPLRDALLVRYTLTGDELRLFVLVAPHLGRDPGRNDAWTDDTLHAFGGGVALCVDADVGFRQASAGFVGASDGWQDFARNGTMTWRHDRAEGGNVALTAELAAPSGTLVLAFATTPEGARTLCRSSLAEGFAAARSGFVAGWTAWASGLKIPDAPQAIRDEAVLSATVLKVHEDRTFPGAVVASLSVPWGETRADLGGYHLVWARDAVEAGLGLLAVGQVADARRMLSYLIATQSHDGHWTQNFYPDGRPFWTGVQLDETGFPILLAAKLREQGALEGVRGVTHMVRAAAAYLARHGPASPQDRWEENAGIGPFTLAVEVAALVAASAFLEPDAAAYALSLADAWNERIEAWTYVEGDAREAEFAAVPGVDGYYVRIAPPEGGLRGRVRVRNRADESVAVADLVSLDFLYLARLGLRRPDDPRMRSSLALADAVLRVDTPCGPGYHRYDRDGYGEHADGRPFDGSGIGRAWPLLTGERGHMALQRGEEALAYLEAMRCMSGRAGLLPEQVWDTDAMPERGLEPGRPTGSAMPLMWAHAEFVKLVHARASGKPIELLGVVEDRYGARRPEAATWHWRSEAPFERLPAGRDLLVEAHRPFVVHAGFDGWRDVHERPSRPLGLGMHGVRWSSRELAGHDSLEFTRRDEDGTWEGTDHFVRW